MCQTRRGMSYDQVYLTFIMRRTSYSHKSLAIALRSFNPQTHCTCLLPAISTSLQFQRTILDRFFGRRKEKKEREILDPLDPKFLKRSKPTPPSQPRPQQGDIAPGSIIDDEPSLPAGEAPATEAARLDPAVLAPALDPVPRNRRRWERKMVIQDIRRRGRLTKKEIIMRTERESLSKSPFYKTSIKKLYPLARQIAGKPIEEAIVQMRFSKKKAAKDVKKHLEYARNEAIVKRGMGLGRVKAVAEEGQPEEDAKQGNAISNGMVVVDKEGTRRWVTDKTNIYVDQAWVGRGTYSKSPSYRAKGRVDILMHPKTSKLMLNQSQSEHQD